MGKKGQSTGSHIGRHRRERDMPLGLTIAWSCIAAIIVDRKTAFGAPNFIPWLYGLGVGGGVVIGVICLVFGIH
jgi:hypothetical protein